MSTINTIRARLKALNVNEESRSAIEETKGEIADLNRERMLSGRRADGSLLPFYSKISVEVYGYPPGPWRLKNTGSFQEKINIKVTPLSFITDSADDKSEMLKKKAGEGIFGLDKEGKKEYVKDLRPVFVKNIRAKLSL